MTTLGEHLRMIRESTRLAIERWLGRGKPLSLENLQILFHRDGNPPPLATIVGALNELKLQGIIAETISEQGVSFFSFVSHVDDE